MARRINAASLPSTTEIINFHSAGSTSTTNLNASASNNAREVLSGTLTANTPATLIDLTGRGEVSWLSAYALNSTARTIRMIVTVDGIEVFDATSASVSGTNSGIAAVGAGSSTNVNQANVLRYNSSLRVEVASSLSETDLVAIAYNLHKF